MLILDTDWLPLDAMKLSKNAFFIYKRFVLNKRSGKFKSKKIKISFEEIASYLDLKWSNPRGAHSIIVKALKDMKKNCLVDSFEWRKIDAKHRIYELRFEKTKQEMKNAVHSNSDLKMTA